MTTLHKVAEVSKKVIIGFSIGIFSIIFFAILFKVFANLKESIFPTPPPPPTVLFGKLDPFSFPKNITDKAFTYTLTTVSGNLPVLPTQLPVFKIAAPTASLLSFDKVKTLVARNKFEGDPVALSDTQYQWINDDPISSKLVYNILTSDFSITSDYIQNQDVLAADKLPQNTPDAIQFARDFLTNFESFPIDIDTGKTTTTLLSIQDGKVVPATSLSTAQLIAVDFFQKDLGAYSIYYPNYPSSTMHVVVGSGTDVPQVVEALFNHKIILTEQNSTYPLKTAAQAYEELKTNKAFIANYTGSKTKVTIRDVFLGYYIGEEKQSYVYPIIIFQGDDNFIAYVSAVTDEWIGK